MKITYRYGIHHHFQAGEHTTLTAKCNADEVAVGGLVYEGLNRLVRNGPRIGEKSGQEISWDLEVPADYDPNTQGVAYIAEYAAVCRGHLRRKRPGDAPQR